MNELQNLSQIYSNKLFRIPDYQRGYAWKSEQLVDFWDDLMSLQMNRYHYTGLLSLKYLTEEESSLLDANDQWLIESGFRPCHIVDGQQRITTFSILLNELITFVQEVLESKNKKSEDELVLGYERIVDIRAKYISRKRPPRNLIITDLFGYEKGNSSSDYLKYKIYGEQKGGTFKETYYTKNLEEAKAYFEQQVKDLYEKEGLRGLENIYKKMTLRLMFNIYEINDDYDVFVAFETINNRGKRLTTLELLKNRLIYLTTLYEDEELDDVDKDALRKSINDAWKEVYYQLGRNKDKPLSDDYFLRDHCVMYFSTLKNYSDYLLDKFSAKNVFGKKLVGTTRGKKSRVATLSHEEISDYVQSIKESANCWYYTYFPEEDYSLTEDERDWIKRLDRIGMAYFRPLIYAALATKSKVNEEERIELFKAVERYIFIYFRIGYFRENTYRSYFYKAAQEVYTGVTDFKTITEDINSKATLINDEAVQHFIREVQRLFDNNIGFYGWTSLKYMLYEYERSLMEGNRVQKVDWTLFTDSEKDRVSVEHIFPKAPTKQYWLDNFKEYINDNQKIKALAGSLGNLLLLSESVNMSLQNDGFIDKKNSTTELRKGYEDGSHSAIEVSKAEKWSPEEILKRGMQLLSFMEKRWNLSLGTARQKKSLLHLEFMPVIKRAKRPKVKVAQENSVKPVEKINKPIINKPIINKPKIETKTIVKPVEVKTITPNIKPQLNKPITKPIIKSISKPITKPIIKSITKPIIKSITKPRIIPNIIPKQELNKTQINKPDQVINKPKQEPNQPKQVINKQKQESNQPKQVINKQKQEPNQTRQEINKQKQETAKIKQEMNKQKQILNNNNQKTKQVAVEKDLKAKTINKEERINKPYQGQNQVKIQVTNKPKNSNENANKENRPNENKKHKQFNNNNQNNNQKAKQVIVEKISNPYAIIGEKIVTNSKPKQKKNKPNKVKQEKEIENKNEQKDQKSVVKKGKKKFNFKRSQNTNS